MVSYLRKSDPYYVPKHPHASRRSNVPPPPRIPFTQAEIYWDGAGTYYLTSPDMQSEIPLGSCKTQRALDLAVREVENQGGQWLGWYTSKSKKRNPHCNPRPARATVRQKARRNPSVEVHGSRGHDRLDMAEHARKSGRTFWAVVYAAQAHSDLEDAGYHKDADKALRMVHTLTGL